MLFLQGTRDSLADLVELRPVLDELGAARAAATSSTAATTRSTVPKRSGRDATHEVLDEIRQVHAQGGGSRRRAAGYRDADARD